MKINYENLTLRIITAILEKNSSTSLYYQGYKWNEAYWTLGNLNSKAIYVSTKKMTCWNTAFGFI